MGLFGGKLNLIFGFDTVSNNLKVMSIVGSDITTAMVEYLPFSEDLRRKGDWAGIIGEVVPEYIKRQSFQNSFAVWLVLPNNVIGTDIVTVPTLSASKMATAIDTKLNEFYKFYKDYKFNRYLLTGNKTNTTFEIFMVEKNLLQNIYKKLNESKLYAKNCTYSASCLVNAVLALRPKNRHSTFIFIDVKGDVTTYSIVHKGVTVGWTTLPFGHKILESTKVLIEQNLYDNDISEIAVINATERARKRKMTVIDEDDEDSGLIEENAIALHDMSTSSGDEIPEGAEGVSENESVAVDATEVSTSSASGSTDGSDGAEKKGKKRSSKKTAAESVVSGDVSTVEKVEDGVTGDVKADGSVVDGAVSGSGEGSASGSADGSASGSADGSAQGVAEQKTAEAEVAKPKAKAYVRKAKRVAAFMMRPTPETQEGMAVENFRIFVKHALIIKQFNALSEYMAEPSYVLVNMPKEYNYIIDEINAEGNGIEFVLFDPSKENNTQLTENLDLFGAIYMNQFNKVNNF